MFRKLFGSLLGNSESGNKSQSAKKSVQGPTSEYKGYTIIPMPEAINGQYRVSGIIQRESPEGEIETHRFERSDTVPDQDACLELIQIKAERFIDDVGEEMFR